MMRLILSRALFSLVVSEAWPRWLTQPDLTVIYVHVSVVALSLRPDSAAVAEGLGRHI
jgi:hypothetical protein